MHRVLILSSAAIVLSACSMDGAGTYYDQSGVNKGCVSCGPAGGYSVGHTSPYHSAKPAHHTGYTHAQSHGYAATQPDAHAYGTHAPKMQYAGGHHAQNHYGAPRLRGLSSAHRQGYKYGNLGAVMYDVDDSVFGVQGRLGYQSAYYVGAELEGSVGVIGDSETVGTTEFDSSIKHSFAGFGVGRVPVTDRVNLLGRLGYHNTKAKLSVDDGTTVTEATNTVVGLAYGAGAEYAVNNRDSLRLDYTVYEADTGGSLDSISLAFARKF